MARTLRALTLPLLLVLTFGLSACSGGTGESSESAKGTAISAETILFDVRTPEEYAAGHLEGAQLLDFNAGDVEAAIPELDPNAEYAVYCRSGNRSGQTVALLKDAGFAHVTDLGAMESAADTTGIAIVTD